MFDLQIQTSNAAFAEEPGYELARILRKLADRVELIDSGCMSHGTVNDINGNKVGTFRLETEN